MRKFLKKLEVTNITNLTNYQIDKLEVGDVVAKNTNGQYHYYIVSYKQENVGICLTYTDATYLETISYDYVEGNWVYNSQDSTVVASKSYVDSLMSGALKRAIVEALPEEDIDTNTIYMVLDESASQQGNVYNEYLYINSAWELIGTTETSISLYEHYIEIFVSSDVGSISLKLETTSQTAFSTVAELYQYFKDNEIIYKSNEHNYVPVTHYSVGSWGYVCMGMSADDTQTNKFQFGIVYVSDGKLKSTNSAYTPQSIIDVVKPLQ